MSLSEYNALPRPKPKKRPTIPRGGFAVAGFVLVAAISFFGGMQYQKGRTPNSTGSQASNTSAFGQGQGNAPGGFSGGSGGFQRGDRAVGTVSTVSSSSITIQSRNGNNSTYTITGSTTVTNNGQTASVSDIQTGNTVFLTLDSSNTQDVSSIMLNPSFGGFGPGAGGSGAPASPDATGTNAAGA